MIRFLPLILLVWAALPGLPATAQTPSPAGWLPRPLVFVPADSVSVWGYQGTDPRQLAFALCPDARVRSFNIDSTHLALRERIARIARTFMDQRNAVGGGGDPFADPQGLPAMMQAATFARLFLLTGQAVWMDAVERSVYNAALHVLYRAATADSAATATTPGRPAASATASRDNDLQSAAETVLAYPGMMLATGDSTLFVNGYTNATARVPWGGRHFVLDMITYMPRDGNVKLRFMHLPRTGARFRLCLRLPDWSGWQALTAGQWADLLGSPECPIYINGHEMLPHWCRADGRGYVVIDHTWHTGDELFVRLPLPARYVELPGRHEVCLQRGPLLYALAGGLAALPAPSGTDPLRAPFGIDAEAEADFYGFYPLTTVPETSADSPPTCARPYATADRGTVDLPLK